MTDASNLAERIARLEQLLDGLARARRGEAAAPHAGGAPAADRIVELSSLVRQRLSEPRLDQADALTLRALLEELGQQLQELRARATDLSTRLNALDAQAARAGTALKTLETPR